jgi:hypothetical protein
MCALDEYTLCEDPRTGKIRLKPPEGCDRDEVERVADKIDAQGGLSVLIPVGLKREYEEP